MRNLLLGLAMLTVFAFVGPVNAQTRLEVRLAEEQPAAGLVAASVPHSDKKVYLHDAAVVTNADITSARVVAASGTSFNIAVSLTSQGATNLAAATRAHIGRPLAIVVNGTVVAAPILRDPIGQDALITGDFTKQEADEIAAGLTGR